MKTKNIGVMIVTLTLLLASSLNAQHQWRSQRGLDWKLPGYPEELHQIFISTHVKGANDSDKITDSIYQKMFPGSLAKGAKASYVENAMNVRNGLVGATTLTANSRPNYRAIGSHSDPIGSVKVEVYREGDLDTEIHETAHSYNASLRGTMGGYHFFDEGMAVLMNWIFHAQRCEEEAINLNQILKECPTPIALKNYALRSVPEIPPGHVYPFAGFFMTQVYDLAGAKTVKYLLCADQKTDGVDKVYSQILQDVQQKSHLDEDAFWILMHERLIEWTR